LTRAALQAAIIASAVATSVDIGFSQSTCLPALAARIVYSECIEFGNATYTASMAGLRAISSKFS
jgi:hypothetical protein